MMRNLPSLSFWVWMLSALEGLVWLIIQWVCIFIGISASGWSTLANLDGVRGPGNYRNTGKWFINVGGGLGLQFIMQFLRHFMAFDTFDSCLLYCYEKDWIFCLALTFWCITFYVLTMFTNDSCEEGSLNFIVLFRTFLFACTMYLWLLTLLCL